MTLAFAVNGGGLRQIKIFNSTDEEVLFRFMDNRSNSIKRVRPLLLLKTAHTLLIWINSAYSVTVCAALACQHLMTERQPTDFNFINTGIAPGLNDQIETGRRNRVGPHTQA